MSGPGWTVERTIDVAAGLLVALLLLGLPGVYFSVGYQYTRGILDTQAELSAHDLGRLVAASPTTWRLEQPRLLEILERRSSAGTAEAHRIHDGAGRLVAESADWLPPPVLARRHHIRDATGLVAEVEVARSLRPLAVETGLALLFALLLAGLVLALLRTIPLRAIRRAARSQAESERKYRSLYESMREGLALHRVVRHPEGGASLELVDANPACVRMLGLGGTNPSGKDPGLLLGGALAPLIPRLVAEAGALEPHAFDFSPGGDRTFSVSAFSPKEGFLATLLEDVTEQRRLQEHLAHAEKIQAVGRLAGGVAHDFNNILTVILACARSLAATLEGEDREQAQEIAQAAQRAAELTRQLLTFSRRQVLQPELLQVEAVVGELGRMIRRLIGEQIDLRVEVEPGAGAIRMDPAQFEQVLVNLAVNARDAMPEGGRLSITARAVAAAPATGRVSVAPGPAGWVVLTVSDTGTGIDEATRSRIFEPFFTTKPRGKGTGLGLATAFGAVQQAGGSLKVSSRPGAGTTFTIRLPRVEGPAAPATERRPARSEGPGGGGQLVLLVEDDPQLRVAIRRMLTEGGYAVVEAADGEAGLAAFLADTGEVALVVTDLVMPGMGGLALGRAVEARRSVPVLYMSGYSEEMATGAERLPPERFLQKPFDAAALLSRVAALLKVADRAAPVLPPLPGAHQPAPILPPAAGMPPPAPPPRPAPRPAPSE